MVKIIIMAGTFLAYITMMGTGLGYLMFKIKSNNKLFALVAATVASVVFLAAVVGYILAVENF